MTQVGKSMREAVEETDRGENEIDLEKSSQSQAKTDKLGK